MSPESMERMGVLRIYKEAARLFRHHFRLFLPFFLAFHLPATFLSLFYSAFLVPQNASTNDLISAYTTGHGDAGDVVLTIILQLVVMAPMVVLSILGFAAFTYVVDYVYSDLSDDDAVTRRVFKLLPHACLRVIVTQLWQWLVLVLLTVACALLAFVLLTLYALVAGDGNLPPPAVFLVVFSLPLVAGCVVLSIVFANANPVAVLEQGTYGRDALKQSRRYARGRAWIIFRVLALGSVVTSWASSFASGVATAGLSLATVAAVSAVSIVFAICTAYVALAVVVTYFVCKSGSDDAALPIQNPYRPVASAGSTQVGEP